MAKFNFKETGFILVKPPSKIVSQHRLKNDAEYETLLDRAINNGYCLYSAPVIRRDGKYVAIQPWQLDADTIPQRPQEEIVAPVPIDELCCPFCNKRLTSTPGRTLHVKSHHSDRLEEYMQWQKSLGKKSRK